MRRTFSIIAGAILVVTLGAPAWAHPGNGKGGGGGGESQAGGLPGLEDRVDALQSQVTTLQNDVNTLTGEVMDLQGQNNWAVVDSDGTVERNSGASGSVKATITGTGVYDVVFYTDGSQTIVKSVADCAYVATLGDTGSSPSPVGFIGVSSDGTGGVLVQTSTPDTTAIAPTDESFHLYVSCP